MTSPATIRGTEREWRRRPRLSAVGAARLAGGPFRLMLLAPNEADFNTLHLTVSAEARIVTDRDVPLANERCVLWLPNGSTREALTNAEGVVHFDGLPMLCASDESFADVMRPALQLPDVLEEWPANAVGDFAKSDSYRARDGMVHFIPVNTAKHPVRVNGLTEEEKFQHFCNQYTDNKAKWGGAKPKDYDNTRHRWAWGRGAVCNQHVNFFLAFWFNYNAAFTTSASRTGMTCLSLYDASDTHDFPVVDKNEKTGLNETHIVHHRGYSEFLEPVEGFGKRVSEGPVASAEHWQKAYRSVEYVRMAQYLERGTGNPKTPRGAELLSSLANFNVYSVADIKEPEKRKAAIGDVRAWLKKHKSANGLSDAQISGLSETEIWNRVYDLDDENEDDARLIDTLRDGLLWDHHCGILARRAPGGGPPGAAPPYEWWTFSADGSKTSPLLITMKKFADSDLNRRLLHLGLWKLKPLRPGGYSPANVAGNAGGISIDEPPRHIYWV